jgi:biopolymer transport protein ExbD/biopolymer transport protein TolR
MSRVGNRPQPQMNVTPLVDVVLVLLIIFMVVVPMMEKTHIELPGIFHVDEDPKGKVDPFTLSLSSDGRMFFEKDELSPDSFKQRLSEALERQPARRLILRADRNAPYGKVRKLFAICQEIGFPGISLRVNEVKAGPASGKKQS